MRFICVDNKGAETVLTEGKEYETDRPLTAYIAFIDDKNRRNYFRANRFLRADTVCAYTEEEPDA